MRKYLFTSESVTEGHPDKMCDKICDKILDCALEIDPYSHIAIEATIKDNFILLYGEASTKAKLDYAKIAKDVAAGAVVLASLNAVIIAIFIVVGNIVK